MKYKLIAVDMDGTLLNDLSEITQRNLEVIEKARQKGVMFSISTGRPIQGIKKFNHILKLDCPVIAYNGAMLANPNTNEIIFEKSLDNDAARKIWNIGKLKNTTMCVWSNHKLYTNVLNKRTEAYRNLQGIEPILIDDIENLLENRVTKILWSDEESNISKWQEEFLKEDFGETTLCTSKPYFLEFFNKQVSKALTLERLAKLYNIKRDEIIAMGDGYNDLSMIEYAGLGVAMENGDERVKAKADYVTASNEKDGVAEVIEKFVLKN